MSRLKTMTIVGTRPEIIRLSCLIPKLDALTEHTFVHTGQNSDPTLNDVFFRDLNLRAPDHYLGVDTSSIGAVMGETLEKTEKLLSDVRPDAVLILGDTNSAIAAIIAERMQIPVYHMEAGNRSFDANVPEELNRRMVDHVASFNLPYNDFSMRNLLSEGIHPRRISKTGSPIREIFIKNKEAILSSDILERLGLEKQSYVLASVHRQENVDFPNRLAGIVACLQAVQTQFQLPVLVSTHPRTQKRLDDSGLKLPKDVTFHQPFGYLDYNNLQMHSFVVISDSGTISEESSILNFPAVCIRESIERPEALETGAMILTGLEPESVVDSIRLATSKTDLAQPEGYEVSDFSERVLRFVFSTAKLHSRWAGLHAG